MKARFTSVKECLRYLADNKRLSNEDCWNIITAMRGPDDRNYELKRQTTGVIRGFLFTKRLPGAVVFDGTGMSVLKICELGFTSPLVKEASSHFLSHAEKAVRSLRKIRKAARQ